MTAEENERYTLDLDIRYGVCLNKLQARLLSRVDTLLKIVEMLLGSVAVVSFFNGNPKYTAIAGLVLAIINAVKFAIDFGDMAAKSQVQGRRFSDLILLADALPIADLKRHLKNIQGGGDAPEIESLRLPAYNLNLLENGRDDAMAKLSWRESFMRSIA